jgi:hypothetical protein
MVHITYDVYGCWQELEDLLTALDVTIEDARKRKEARASGDAALAQAQNMLAGVNELGTHVCNR